MRQFRPQDLNLRIVNPAVPELEADFFVCLREGTDEPRACWRKGRKLDRFRNDWMLVAIEPPVCGQPYGLGSDYINHLLLTHFFRGRTLFPISYWPTPVYVVRILDQAILEREQFDDTDIQLLDWGVVHRTYEEARLGK